MQTTLSHYVTTMRSLGYSDRDIIQELLHAGWEQTLLAALVDTAAPEAISASGLTRVYEDASGGTIALQHADLSIHKGESVAIVGKSGSGKSTLMHILATLDRPTSGTLSIDGRPTTELSAKEIDHLRNKKVSFVFQQFFLNGRATCLENVMLPLTIAGTPVAERMERARNALAAVDLSEKEVVPAAKLSGGQKQRLCIARALVTEPEIIFADEPTGNLDTENGHVVIDLLFRIQKERNITLVVVTHDPDLAALCGRTITISDGAIVHTPSHAN